MFVYRARAACPHCNSEEEIWYSNGKVTPMSTIQCHRCSFLYDPTNYTTSFLELRQNITVSAISARSLPYFNLA